MKRNIIYKLLLIFGILCSLFLGCGREIIDKDYSVKTNFINQTPYTIKLEKYFTFRGQTEKDIYTLLPNEILSTKVVNDGGCYVDGISYSKGYSCQLSDSDSVIVTFDNSKKIVFKPEDEAMKGIYKIENFELFKEDNASVYTFKFTEAHYQQAK